MTLSIGVDYRPTEPGFKSHAGRGTGRYTEELVKQLHLVGPERGVEVLQLGSKEFLSTPTEQAVYQALPLGKVTFSTQFLLPRAMKRQPVDGFHFFHHGDAPAHSGVPRVVSVLDLIPLRFPKLYKADNRNLRFHLARFLENRSIRGSLGILTISEASKKDIVELLGVPSEQIAVTPLAVAKHFYANEQRSQSSLREIFGLPPEQPILLYVGGIDPRKNVPFLLNAFSALCAQKTSSPLLVLAGSFERDRHYPGLCAQIKALGLAENIRLLGFVPDEKLPALYQAADLMVFPSLYEGFGLPVLESMASGTPVVAGNNSSIPEVTGREGALLLPNNDIESWVRGIGELLQAREERHRLSHEGKRRAQMFSWTRTAELTCDAYKEFFGRNESNKQSAEALPD